VNRILIRGGRLFDPAASLDRATGLLVADGLVARIGEAAGADGAHVIDAAGCIVAPGLVDLHAHLREPGFEYKGTIATETAAAARGGFTTVCAMPNTDPPIDSGAMVEALLDRVRATAVVRVLPIGCVTRGRAGKEMAELTELAAAGCVAFSDDGNPVADAVLMRRALQNAGAIGIPLSEHSDDSRLGAGGVMHEGRISERLGLAGQPAAAEVAAIARNVALAEETGAHVHIAHISTARGVELVAEAKARGLPVTCEVTPSHLFLTEDAVFGPGPVAAYDTNARVNPPLRTEDDRRALLAGLRSGVIDAIATDHAPHAREDKLCEFDYAAPGISCFETALATVLTLVERGELGLARAIEAMTAGPARTFALDRRLPGVGAIAEGGPADIVVFDPAERWPVDVDAFASKGKNSPLHGHELTGRVRATIVAGQLAYAAGREEVPA
jgi:dihydroorotase